MAKKNHTLGKLLALTTTVAAIGGACYIFRDKIQQSAIFQKSKDKLSGLFGKDSDDFDDDDDFFFDDEDDIISDDTMFSDSPNNDREYTSIAINPAQEDEDSYESPLPEAEPDTDTFTVDIENPFEDTDTVATAEDTIPTISYESGFGTPVSTPEPPTIVTADDAEEETVTAYEYEGLSDVSEDPDVLEEQDKLDF